MRACRSRLALFLLLVVIGLGVTVRAGVTALSCDGSDSYVLVGTPAALQIPNNGPLTIEGWVYLNTWDAGDTFYSKNNGRGSTYTYLFGCVNSGDISAYNGSTWMKPTPVVKAILGQWCHLAFSFNGSTMTYYLNGASLGTSAFSFANTTAHTIKIGGYSTAADINGKISDVRVWNHARSQAQIQSLMSRRLTGSEPGLLGYWRLDEGTGTTAHDLTANNSDGTLVGAAWAATDLELAFLTVAHPVTGSTRFTNTNEVDVTFFPEIEGYTHYQITEGGAAPDGSPGAWTATNTPPATIAFSSPATDANVLLTVWYTNLNAAVSLKSAATDIIYTTVAPTASAQATLTRHIALGYTTVNLFGADLDAGSGGGTALGEVIGISGFTLSCAEDTTPDDSARVTLDDTGVYDVILTVMNEAGNTASAATVVTVVEGVTRTWNGAGGDKLASTAANWSGGAVPQHGDSVLFDATSTKACDWDLNIDLLAWTQTAGYSGTVTVWTEYPGISGGTGFTNLTIAGDAELNGGFWTHRANRGVNDAWDRLCVSVAGNFTLGINAGINVTTNGFAGGRGPGAGVDAQDAGSGASHGGTGGFNHDRLPSPTYGSSARPETLGSGTSTTAGGGALHLTVGGQAQIDGLIQADGYRSDRRAGSSGGSIFVQAATVSGTGTLRADGGAAGGYSGGGGRVALIATASGTLGGITAWARSGTAAANGTAGTIFLQTTAGPELIVNQAGLAPQAPIDRVYPFPSRFRVEGELPARLNTPDALPAAGGELENASLSISNKAWVKLTADLRMGDFKRLSSDSTFDLNGHTLFLKAAAPAGAFPGDHGGGTLVTNGGRIVWGNAAPTVKLNVYTYNSTVAANPVSPTGDGYYPLNTDVTLTVTPDANYTFLWWKGDLPVGVARTTYPLTIKMDGRRDLTPVVARSDVTTCTWTGEGANRNASTAANWYPSAVPVSGKHIVFNATSDVECYWDLNIEPASWTQTKDFQASYSMVATVGHKGFVWIKTLYPGQGAFTNLAIRGDCTLDGGAWTHVANTGVDVAKDRLSVTADGSFRLNTQAWINVVNRGYASLKGPGAGAQTANRPATGRGGSHGGLGNYTIGQALPGKTYGSITAPTALGSGANGIGGGAVLIHATHDLVIDGDIFAFADRNWIEPTISTGPAGGSIYLRGASVAGAGRLSVKGSPGYQCGGGGRIAVIATHSTGFGDLTLDASGFPRTGQASSAGTIYLEGWTNGAPSVRRLIIDNMDIVTPTHIAAELMPSYESYDPVPAVGGEIEDAALEIVRRGRVQLTSSLLMGDFDRIDVNSTINLNGSTLFLNSEEPAGAFPGDYGGGTVLTNGGNIVWAGAMIDLSLVVTNGPHGTAARNPYSPDDLYEYGSDVLVSATPDAGYVFVYWEGDVPAGSNRTSNPLLVPINQARSLRAIFASSAPATHTWIGDGANVLASNPDNWYPGVPTTGANIVLDSTSRKEIYWDLDVALGSWTQTEGFEAFYSPADGYRGWVVIQTKYPGQGAFTNLTITGNCTLLGGTWTHPANSGDHTAVDRMSVTIGGDFVLGTNALIDVYGRGFATARGPGAGNNAQRPGGTPIMVGGSHGGRGGYGSAASPASCYGSLLAPEHLGSGASGGGGGAVRLDVTGAARIDGTIDARGRNASELQPGPAGGSIWLTAATLSGNGTLNASSDVGFYAGGGGRVAVHLNNTASFGNVTLLAHSGYHSGLALAGSGPGTVVKRDNTGKVDLHIDNLSRTIAWTNVYAELPASIGGDLQSLRDMSLHLTNKAQAGIHAPDVRLRDIVWIDATSRLYLNGQTVVVRSPYHAFTDGDEDVVVVKDGGQLIWTPSASIIILR